MFLCVTQHKCNWSFLPALVHFSAKSWIHFKPFDTSAVELSMNFENSSNITNIPE